MKATALLAVFAMATIVGNSPGCHNTGGTSLNQTVKGTVQASAPLAVMTDTGELRSFDVCPGNPVLPVGAHLQIQLAIPRYTSGAACFNIVKSSAI